MSELADRIWVWNGDHPLTFKLAATRSLGPSMSELADRLEAFPKNSLPGSFDQWKGLNETLCEAAAALRAMEWVSVDERLPEGDTTVIVQGGIAHRYNGQWRTLTATDWPGKFIQWEVTHWMPLPDPLTTEVKP